jgi:hypothetical protein
MNTDHDYFTAYSFGGVRIASTQGRSRRGKEVLTHCLHPLGWSHRFRATANICSFFKPKKTSDLFGIPDADLNVGFRLYFSTWIQLAAFGERRADG